MNLNILTPVKTVFSGEADRIQMPGSSGKFEVLKDHAPLIASLKDGDVKVTNGSDVQTFGITGGFVEVLRNSVTILAEGVAEE